MIAAAIVCAAAVSQAAVVAWSAMEIYDATGENVLQADPGIYLAKIIGETPTKIGDPGEFLYDSGDNLVEGTYTLVVGTDFDGDKYTFVTADGSALTDLDGNALVYTLSGFGQDTKSTGVPRFDVENVKVAAVPEPTSGLLLLLGVAGMALRRRRA